MQKSAIDRHPEPSMLAWLRLVRIANWPSAISNILAAALVANGTWTPISQLITLLAISLCLFSAGMVLNDWYDYKLDEVERPHRPIPSGSISRNQAVFLAITLIVSALLLSLWLDWRLASEQRSSMLTTCIAATTAALIVGYDVLWKRTVIAPILMGLCRAGNFCLGASAIENKFPTAAGLPWPVLILAATLAVYVTGITLIAKRESSERLTGSIVVGQLLAMVAFVSYFLLPTWQKIVDVAFGLKNQVAFQYLIVWTAVVFTYHALKMFTAKGANKSIQKLVVTGLKGIIVLDTALALGFGNGSIQFACLVIALYPISVLLSRLRPLT